MAQKTNPAARVRNPLVLALIRARKKGGQHRDRRREANKSACRRPADEAGSSFLVRLRAKLLTRSAAGSRMGALRGDHHGPHRHPP